MKLFCCKCTPADNFKSLVQRKPSSLAVLDGMRFMAVMWVFVMHASANVKNFYKCTNFENVIWMLVRNGDRGVDIFFVLSGFLISYVLKREYDKYGDIDWKHFMKMRFFRLYPGLLAFLTVTMIAMLLL